MTATVLRRVLATAVSAAALLAATAGQAAAHPGGLPAILQVTAEATSVRVAWRAPADDVAVAVEAAGGADRLGAYLLDHVAVIQDGKRCRGTVARLETPEAGAELVFDCPRLVEVVTLRADILLDVDRAYQTLAVAPVRSGADRVLFTGTTTERDFHLSGDPPPATGGDEQAAAVEDLSRGLGIGLERRFVAAVGGGLRGWMIAAGLALALAVGAAHALGPGHGKSVAAAYLVGERAQMVDAVAIGVSVAAMHTVAVLGLGLATWWTTRSVGASAVVTAIAVGAGLAVACLGAWMTARRIRELRGHGGGDHEGHLDPGDVGHTHVSLEGASPLSARGVAVVAASGGLVPSPTALVVLLAAVAVGRVALGLALVAAFSVGLAAAVTAAGLAVLWGRDRLVARGRRWVRARHYLPLAGSVAVVVAGLWLTARAVIAA